MPPRAGLRMQVSFAKLMCLGKGDEHARNDSDISPFQVSVRSRRFSKTALIGEMLFLLSFLTLLLLYLPNSSERNNSIHLFLPTFA